MNPKDLHGKLADIHSLCAKTDAAERKIMESAAKRLAVIQHAIDVLPQSQILTEPTKARRYEALLHERATLHQVVADAKHALGE